MLRTCRTTSSSWATGRPQRPTATLRRPTTRVGRRGHVDDRHRRIRPRRRRRHAARLHGERRVTVTGPNPDLQVCTEVQDEGIVVWNVATVTSGGYVTDDDACQVVHFDDIGIEKTATGLAADGTVEPGDSFDYVLTVTNHGDRRGDERQRDRRRPQRPARDHRLCPSRRRSCGVPATGLPGQRRRSDDRLARRRAGRDDHRRGHLPGPRRPAGGRSQAGRMPRRRWSRWRCSTTRRASPRTSTATRRTTATTSRSRCATSRSCCTRGAWATRRSWAGMREVEVAERRAVHVPVDAGTPGNPAAGPPR